MDTFASRLRYARLQRKLSQNALARVCGLSQGAISSYETGHRQSTKEIFKLAQVLKVNPTWLSLGSGPMDVVTSPTLSEASRAAHHLLGETNLAAPSTHWPFQELQEKDYWSLTDQERDLVDHTLAALVKQLKIQNNR